MVSIHQCTSNCNLIKFKFYKFWYFREANNLLYLLDYETQHVASNMGGFNLNWFGLNESISS